MLFPPPDYMHQMKRNANGPSHSFQASNYSDLENQQNNYQNQQLNATFPPYRNQDFNTNAIQSSQRLYERRNVSNLPALNAINLYQQQLLIQQQQTQQFIQQQQQEASQQFGRPQQSFANQSVSDSMDFSNPSNTSNSSFSNISGTVGSGNISPNLRYLRYLYSLFEPPKPDTPPANVFPVWMDPTWGNHAQSPKIDCLNIPMPELKTFNMLPIVVTPCYDITVKNVFNFDENLVVKSPKGEDSKGIK